MKKFTIIMLSTLALGYAAPALANGKGAGDGRSDIIQVIRESNRMMQDGTNARLMREAEQGVREHRAARMRYGYGETDSRIVLEMQRKGSRPIYN